MSERVKYNREGYYFPATAAAATLASREPAFKTRNFKVKVTKPGALHKSTDKISGEKSVHLSISYGPDERGTSDLSDFWKVIRQKKEEGGIKQRLLTKAIEVFKY